MDRCHFAAHCLRPISVTVVESIWFFDPGCMCPSVLYLEQFFGMRRCGHHCGWPHGKRFTVFRFCYWWAAGRDLSRVSPWRFSLLLLLLAALFLLRVSHPFAKRGLSQTSRDCQSISRWRGAWDIRGRRRNTKCWWFVLNWRVLLLVEVHALDSVNLVTPDIEQYRFTLRLGYLLSRISQVSWTQWRVIDSSGILKAVPLYTSPRFSAPLPSKSRHHFQIFGWRVRGALKRHHLFLVVHTNGLITILPFALPFKQSIREIEGFLRQIVRRVRLLQLRAGSHFSQSLHWLSYYFVYNWFYDGHSFPIIYRSILAILFHLITLYRIRQSLVIFLANGPANHRLIEILDHGWCFL